MTCVALASTAAAALLGAPGPTLAARAFFGAVFAGGAVAAAGLWGARAQAVCAVAVAVLFAGQRALTRQIPEPPPSLWTTTLDAPGQYVEHTIALPQGDAELQAFWRGADTAAVWLCARGPLGPSRALEVLANGALLGTATEADAAGPRPQPDSVGLYRLPLDRAWLERQSSVTFRVQRAPGVAEAVDVCGTFSYRPTAGLGASVFFDGSHVIEPGMTKHGRYEIELRLEDRGGRILRAVY